MYFTLNYVVITMIKRVLTYEQRLLTILFVFWIVQRHREIRDSAQ